MSERALSAEEIGGWLAGMPGWRRTDGVIHRVFETDGWRGSMLVANAVGFICEAADHHADVLITWPRVTVSLSTHSAGGITAKDLEVASLIERQVRWQPGPGSSLNGPATPFVKPD
jgi:pterin-4a-carbinolamine dehydratase